MINNHPFFKDLNIRIPIIVPIKGRGFVNHGSGLTYSTLSTCPNHCNAQGKQLHVEADIYSRPQAVEVPNIKIRSRHTPESI